MTAIEKDQEILVCYHGETEFVFGSRDFRRQELVMRGFLCSCSECSLAGEDLEDNERTRAEFRETAEELTQRLRYLRSDQVPRRDVKKAMKLSQQKTKLIQKLSLRSEFVCAMINFYRAATRAREMDISILENDPDIFKQEALKYAKMFGDNYIHKYNKLTINY